MAFLIGKSAEAGTAVVGAGFMPISKAKPAKPSSSARRAARSLCGAEVGWEDEFLRYEDSCRHEAAHAIVAHHFGATVLEAHVKPDGSGHVQWALPSPRPTSQDEARMRICIAMAGNVQDRLDNRHNAGSTKDMQQITGNVAALLSIGQEPHGEDPCRSTALLERCGSRPGRSSAGAPTR